MSGYEPFNEEAHLEEESISFIILKSFASSMPDFSQKSTKAKTDHFDIVDHDHANNNTYEQGGCKTSPQDCVSFIRSLFAKDQK